MASRGSQRVPAITARRAQRSHFPRIAGDARGVLMVVAMPAPRPRPAGLSGGRGGPTDAPLGAQAPSPAPRVLAGTADRQLASGSRI